MSDVERKNEHLTQANAELRERYARLESQQQVQSQSAAQIQVTARPNVAVAERSEQDAPGARQKDASLQFVPPGFFDFPDVPNGYAG